MNEKLNPVSAMITAKLNGQEFKAIDFTKKHPNIVVALSKLVTPDASVRRRHDHRGNTEIDVPNQQNFQNVSESIIQKDKDSETVKQLFPEMVLGSQIVISSVLAPKDMSTVEINYTVPDNLKVTPLAAELSQLVTEYFTQTYKIEPLLPEILEEVLFGPGAYPIAVIPENSVDDLINGSSVITTEALSIHANSHGVFRPLGILGPAKNIRQSNFSIEAFVGSGKYDTASLENYHVTQSSKDKFEPFNHLFITDNPYGLKMPSIIKARQEADVAALLGRKNVFSNTGFETFKTEQRKLKGPSSLSDAQLQSLFYKNKGNSWKQTVKVKTNDEISRRTIGEPLKLRLPPESVMPVFTPGNPEQHVGYFVILDSEGNPVFKTSYQSEFASLRSTAFNKNMASSLLQQAGREVNGQNCDAMTFDQAAQVYADIVEADLLARLRNGVYGSSVSVAQNEEIYRIMLARTMKKQNTQLMYIPADLVTYFAYKYNSQGIGKSLFDDTLTLQSLRGMMLFSQVQGAVKNAIGRQRIKIKLSEEDPNPQSTIEKFQHEISNMRRGAFPVSSLSVSDLTTWVQNAAMEFEYEGHPGMPDTSVEFSENQSSHQEPNTELMELLRRSSIMAFGLSPETVDSAFSTEFATTAIQNNLLLTKRVIAIQDKFVPQLSDHARKVAKNDGNFLERATKIIETGLDRIVSVKDADPMFAEFEGNKPLLVHLLLQEFLSNFEISLGRPDAAQVENTLQAIQNQSDSLDKVIAFHFTDEIITAAFAGQEIADRANEVRAMIKAHCMRKWMAEKRIHPELAEITALDREGKLKVNVSEAVTEHTQRVTQLITGLVKNAQPVAQAASLEIQKATGGEDLGGSAVGSSSSSSGGSSSDDSSSDDTGGDDTGGDGGDDGGDMAGLPPGLPDIGSF